MAPAARLAALLLPAVVLSGCSGGLPPSNLGDPLIAVFDRAPAGAPPDGFFALTGTWRVVEDAAAPTPPNVVEGRNNLTGDTLLIAPDAFQDANASVRVFLAPAERTHLAGLAAHYANPRDYDVVALDAGEGKVKLLRFVNRQQGLVAEAPAEVRVGAWHRLDVSVHQGEYTVLLDGEQVMRHHGGPRPVGGMGVWTRDDGVARFDNLILLPRGFQGQVPEGLR